LPLQRKLMATFVEAIKCTCFWAQTLHRHKGADVLNGVKKPFLVSRIRNN
jgi:hypothetical protein